MKPPSPALLDSSVVIDLDCITEGFDPDRHLPDAADKRPCHTYLPFGTGPPVCIGNAFAMMKSQLVLASVVQRYRLALVPGQAIRPESAFTLRPMGRSGWCRWRGDGAPLAGSARARRWARPEVP